MTLKDVHLNRTNGLDQLIIAYTTGVRRPSLFIILR
jgi:hypothetical protein